MHIYNKTNEYFLKYNKKLLKGVYFSINLRVSPSWKGGQGAGTWKTLSVDLHTERNKAR